MAHFALVENNVVINVVVVDNSAIDANDEEASGVAFCNKHIQQGTWIQSSYNGNIRGNHASIGYTYDEAHDEFIPISPNFPSWTYSFDSHAWEPPVPYPDTTPDTSYIWNEDQLAWVINPTHDIEEGTP